MAALDTNLLLLGTTTVLWASAGAGCLRSTNGDDSRLSTGVGMLVGAALLAFDSVNAPGTGLPLAALALVVFAGLTTIGARLSGLGLVAVAAAALFGLHWAHGAALQQPTVAWPRPWRPLDLTAAVTLGWIAWRGRRHATLSTDTQRLAIATAAGLATAAFAGRFATATSAAGMMIGALPMVFAAARQHTVAWCASIATAFAATLTTSLRAVALHEGGTPHLAGLDDPLLVLAVLQLALGTALWLSYRGTAAGATQSPAASTEPVATPLTTTASAARPTPAPAPTTIAIAEPEPIVEAMPAAIAVFDDFTDSDSEGFSPDSPLEPAKIVRELRTPLTNLVAAVDLAIADQDRKAIHNLSEQLQTYATQMTTAMADIADLERLLRGEIELAEDVFDLPQLLHNCVAELAATAERHDVTVRLDVTNSTPRWLQGDPARIRQLVTRTMQLAVQAATIGPVDISVSTDDDTLHIVMLNQHATNATPDGLGTLFVTEMARAMGGKLEHQLRSSSGSQLHLSLPKQVAPDWEVELIEQDAEASQPRQEPASEVSGMVLLITDNTDHRQLLARLLGRFGAEVITADSGALGRHLMTITHCDLVLLDMQLHGEDPLAIVRAIRADGGETPMLAVSSDCSSGEMERILAAGCNGHIAKPVDGDVLRRALTMHLSQAN